MFHFWHIAAIVLVFALGFILGGGWRKNKSKKEIVVCNQIKNKGSIVVFPSFVWHKVRPVTKGLRYSLVAWNLGNPYV